jgi:hypothetical protein
MKNPTLILLLLLLVTVSACRSFTYTDPRGAKVTSRSFGNRTSIGEFSISTNGAAKMLNYNNDQVAALQAAFAAGIAAAKTAAVIP